MRTRNNSVPLSYKSRSINSISLITTIGALILLIAAMCWKFHIDSNANAEELTSTRYLILQVLIVVLPIFISVFGISVVLEATNYRDVVRESIKDIFVNSDEREEIISKLIEPQELINILQSAVIYNNHADCTKRLIVSEEFKNSIINAFAPIYIESDQRYTRIEIKEGKCVKKISRKQVVVNISKHNGFPFEFRIRCMNDSEVKIKELKINDEVVDATSFWTYRHIEFDQLKVSSYNKEYKFCYMLPKNQKTSIEADLEYELSTNDRSGNYCNRFPCLQLQHRYDVISDKPLKAEFMIFAFGALNEKAKNDYSMTNNSTLNGSGNNYTYNQQIDFNDLSLPGDGYTFLYDDYIS